MNKIYIIVVAVLLLAAATIQAYAQQGRRIISLHYSGGIPVNGLEDFISDENFDGLNLDGRYFLTDNISIGIAAGSNDFTKRYDRQVYHSDNSSISSIRTKYFQTSPMLLTGHYYFRGSESVISPYAGLGMGAYVGGLVQWDGTFSTTESRISFGLKPEVGVLIKIFESVGASIKAGYNHMFYSSEFMDGAGFLEGSAGIYMNF